MLVLICHMSNLASIFIRYCSFKPRLLPIVVLFGGYLFVRCTPSRISQNFTIYFRVCSVPITTDGNPAPYAHLLILFSLFRLIIIFMDYIKKLQMS
jgi:hypothetical protein